jgi:hypothetical protein
MSQPAATAGLAAAVPKPQREKKAACLYTLLTLKGHGFRSLVVRSNSTTSATHDDLPVGARMLRIVVSAAETDLMAFDSKPMDITFILLNIDKCSTLMLFKAFAQGQFPLGVA